MSLEAQAIACLRRLAPPWIDLFKRVATLDLAASDLPTALRAARDIDRTVPGFADFDPASRHAVVPGDPASSLLFHALASPLVKPAGLAMQDYPAPQDLDLIETYILSLEPLAPAAIPSNAVVAVFAYEYRPAPATTHRRQADYAYSRTGIGRIGELPAVWDGSNRCWLNIGTAGRFAVMPARYGAFLAVPRRRSPDGLSVLGDEQPGDDERTFLMPIRKLFDGPDCIAGCTLRLSFAEFHRREKLRRLFIEADLDKPAGLDGPPYLRDSTQGLALAKLDRAGSSLLVSALPEPLVRLARLDDGRIASFRVPPLSKIPIAGFKLNRDNGSPSTFMIITGGLLTAGVEVFLQSFADVSLRPRNAPEFVNMRHRLTGDPAAPLIDLGATLGNDYEDVLDRGNYDAALFEDSIADGCIVATVDGLPRPLPRHPAFSVLAAPKFFPYADQVDIADWVDQFPSHNRKDQFKQGGPKPLHLGRFPPNLTLLKPGSDEPAFSSDDETAVAIVGQPYSAGRGVTQTVLAARDRRPEHRTTTFLTDGASDVFAPGWDVTFAESENGTRFYATFGLGSPFPEDVKLCAAANAFWPAASPDAARTFQRGPTAIPMLDSELGYHPGNPRRTGDPSVGWDGEQGPFIVGTVVNYADIVRSDYVSHALRPDLFCGATFELVDSTELIARIDALRLCIQSLPESSAEVDHTALWLVHAEIADAPPPAAPIRGPCYRYEFVIPTGKPRPTADPRRLEQPFERRYVCYVAAHGVSWATSEQGPYSFAVNPELS